MLVPFRVLLLAAVRAVLVLTILTGVAYPLLVTGAAQLAFSEKADGSLLRRGGAPIGSRLLGQPFGGDEWFHPRPSAAGEGYDATASGASNLGPTNPELLASVEERVAAYRADNGLGPDDPVPVDAVTASASGLDPHISVANAQLQAARVADARGIELELVRELIAEHTETRIFGILGEDGVNVLLLNIAIEEVSA